MAVRGGAKRSGARQQRASAPAAAAAAAAAARRHSGAQQGRGGSWHGQLHFSAAYHPVQLTCVLAASTVAWRCSTSGAPPPHTTRPAACCAGGNPMRPHRHRLTTNLVRGYGLDDKMKVFRPPPRSREEIMHFHADGASGGVGATLGLVRWPPAPCALLAAEGGFREGRRRGSAAQPMESRHEACPPCPLLHSPTSLPSCALAPANQTICKLSMCPARRLCGLPHLCDAGEPGRIHDAGARGGA